MFKDIKDWFVGFLLAGRIRAENEERSKSNEKRDFEQNSRLSNLEGKVEVIEKLLTGRANAS
jgi:hypothetical protein